MYVSLKAHRHISKRRYFEKYCSCDKACQFWALWSTPWRSYFKILKNWRQIYKQTSSTFYTSNDVSRRKNCQYVITRLRNNCNHFSKKNRRSHRRCKSSRQRCSGKKGVLKNFANFTGKCLCWSLFLIKLQA